MGELAWLVVASAALLPVLGLTRSPAPRASVPAEWGAGGHQQALWASALAGAVHGLGALGVNGLGKTAVNTTLGGKHRCDAVVAASGCGRQAQSVATWRWQSGRCRLGLLPWSCECQVLLEWGGGPMRLVAILWTSGSQAPARGRSKGLKRAAAVRPPSCPWV